MEHDHDGRRQLLRPRRALITNLAFGTVGNAIFGVGYQLAAYVRMMSPNELCDSVAARLSSSDKEERREAMIQFTTTMTRLHGFSAFPAAAILSCPTGPIMHLWVGDRLKNEAHLLAATITAQILLLPVTGGDSVTDCWTPILSCGVHPPSTPRYCSRAASSTPLPRSCC